MLPDPLHPAIDHLPLAIAVLLPLAALVVAVAITRQWLPARSWGLVLALHLLLAGGGLRERPARTAWLAGRVFARSRAVAANVRPRRDRLPARR